METSRRTVASVLLTLALACAALRGPENGRAERLTFGHAHLDFVVPPDYQHSENSWFEGHIDTYAPKRACAPVIEFDFYGGYGAGTCGPAQMHTETDTLAGQSWRWAVGTIDGPKCGHRLWRRAPFMDGGITLLASPEDMDALRAAIASASWSSPPNERLIEFAREEEQSRWSYSPGLCEWEPPNDVKAPK